MYYQSWYVHNFLRLQAVVRQTCLCILTMPVEHTRLTTTGNIMNKFTTCNSITHQSDYTPSASVRLDRPVSSSSQYFHWLIGVSDVALDLAWYDFRLGFKSCFLRLWSSRLLLKNIHLRPRLWSSKIKSTEVLRLRLWRLNYQVCEIPTPRLWKPKSKVVKSQHQGCDGWRQWLWNSKTKTVKS